MYIIIRENRRVYIHGFCALISFDQSQGITCLIVFAIYVNLYTECQWFNINDIIYNCNTAQWEIFLNTVEYF